MSKIFKINIFSVHSAGVYKNTANAILFPIFGTLATLNLPIKSDTSSRYQFFFWCKFSIKLSWLQKKKDNKINTILWDRYFIYKTASSTYLKKL